MEPRPPGGRVACAPTLIQEIGPEACPIEAKRVELAHLPAEQRLSAEDVAEIRAIGDNTGCMALKGANPEHEGEERPDRWPLDRTWPTSATAGASTPSATWSPRH